MVHPIRITHAVRATDMIGASLLADSSPIRGALPLGLPDTLSRAPLRRRAPFAWLTRGRSFANTVSRFASASSSYPRGFAPRTPRHALSRAAAPARSVRVAHSRPLVREHRQPVRVHLLVLSEGLRSSDSPTRSLARRCAGALRSRGSLAAARSRTPSAGSRPPHSLIRGASPLGLPDTLSRAPLRRRAPFAWLTRGRSFADTVSRFASAS